MLLARGRLSVTVATSLGSVLAVVLALYVATGSQAAFGVGAVLTLGLALLVSRPATALGPLVVTAFATLVGSELNGAVGKGTAPTGTLRLLDIAACGVLAGTALTTWRHGDLPSLRAIARSRVVRVLALVLAASTLLWVLRGAPRDALTTTDVRLIFLFIATAAIAWPSIAGHAEALGMGLEALGAACAVKAIVIYATGIRTIGVYDRLQSNSFAASQGRRVILVGGDTLIVLTPALVAFTFGRVAGRGVRAGLGLAFVLTEAAILISGTRTTVLAANGLLLAVLAVEGRAHRGVRVAVVGVLAALAVGAVATGTAERFTEKDRPGSGVSFRTDEIRTAGHLPTSKLLLGQGLGGRFASRDTYGAPIISAWSHVLAVWVVLKIGLVGLAALSVTMVWGLVRVLRSPHDPEMLGLGLIIAVGLIAMSMGVDRAALPEGAVLSALALVLTCASMRAEAE